MCIQENCALLVMGNERVTIPHNEDDKEFVVFNEGIRGFSISISGKTYEFIGGEEYPLSWFADKPEQLLENLLAVNFTRPRTGETIARAKIIKKN